MSSIRRQFELEIIVRKDLRVLKGRWIISDKLIASLSLFSAERVRSEGIAGIVTAECSIKCDCMLLEMVINAAVALKIC